MVASTSQLLVQLEKQLEIMVNKLHALEQSNQALETALAETKQKLEKKQEVSRNWQEKYEALKSAQGINAGDEVAKKRAISHIDSLISEVDACIAHLKLQTDAKD
ncbi:MAG: hypothetical protein ACPF95_01395 [Flavobacteriaceae bacterium]